MGRGSWFLIAWNVLNCFIVVVVVASDFLGATVGAALIFIAFLHESHVLPIVFVFVLTVGVTQRGLMQEVRVSHILFNGLKLSSFSVRYLSLFIAGVAWDLNLGQ